MTSSTPLLKEEAHSGDAMTQRERTNTQRGIFVYHLTLAIVVLVRNNLVTALGEETLAVRINILRKSLRSVDVQLARSPKHREGREQSGQAKTMVAVEMRNKNRVNTAEVETLPANLELSTFAAVDQVDLTSKGKCLSRRVVLCSRESRTTSQYMYR